MKMLLLRPPSLLFSPPPSSPCSSSLVLRRRPTSGIFPAITTTLLLTRSGTGITSNSNSNFYHTPVWYDSSNAWHRTIQYHPEQPARIEGAVKKLINEKKILHAKNRHSFVLRDVSPDFESTAYPIDTTAAPENDHSTTTTITEVSGNVVTHDPFTEDELEQAENILRKTHDVKLVDNLRDRCRTSKQRRIDDGKDSSLGFIGYLDEGDTYLTTESYDVCVRAAATWIRCVDYVLEHHQHHHHHQQQQRQQQQQDNDATKTQPIDHRRTAMALTRPPGHHATFTTANGFCLFSFAAAAVRYALEKYPDKIRKVSVLDWDVHYGQGVADILKDEPRARYVSIHQTPAFPYMGQQLEVTGVDNNIKTVPIRADSSWSCGFRQAYEDQVLPFVSSHDDDDGDDGGWKPDLVIVCAGYDALDSDELANVALTAENFRTMTKLLQAHLDKTRKVENANSSSSSSNNSRNKKVPIMFGLEGGYSLGEMAGASGNMPDAVLETLKALHDEDEVNL